jgi:hypothetical protein
MGNRGPQVPTFLIFGFATKQECRLLRNVVLPVSVLDFDSTTTGFSCNRMDAENIFQMFSRMGGAGFFVRRNSWSPEAAAEIVSVGGLEKGALPGPPPYHQLRGAKKLKVMAKISDRGEVPTLQELTSPGTFAYSQIDCPVWWSE